MISADYLPLHGANVHHGGSVLFVRLASDELADTLAWPSEPLERCVALLEELGLSASEIRSRQRWPLGALVREVAEQLLGRIGVAARPAPPAAADPTRELLLPLDAPFPARSACEVAVALVSACAVGVGKQDRVRLRERLEGFDRRHPALLPRWATLAEACRERGIPWRPIEGWWPFNQLGEGVHQIRTDRAETIQTSAVALTENKTASTSLLGRLGVPVAQHVALVDPSRAWEVAVRIGVPVVVKPRGGQQGEGVSVCLVAREEVEEAFARAQRIDRWVLVERFIEGDDHRVLVAGGRLVAVCRREPAAVVADGTSRIGELLAQANADPRRSSGLTAGLNQIRYDADSERVLRDQGWRLESVPPAGTDVRLKSASNWSAGGTAHDVTDTIHPDNAEMCVRAIVACGADVGGCDFLTPDVTRSFREVGGALCEVNTRPALEVHMFAEGAQQQNLMGDILDALYPASRRWRLPTVVVCGAEPEAVGRAVAAALGARGLTVGYAGPSGTTVGGWVLSADRQRVHVAHRRMTEDPTTEAVVVATTADEVLARGAGVDRADLVALIDDGGGADVRRVLERTGALVGLERDGEAIADLMMAATSA